MTEPRADKDGYDGYEAWKGWAAAFAYDSGDALSFFKELNDPALAGKTVLELGFGEGRLLAWLRDQGAHVVGTEINNQLLAAAQKAEFEVYGADLTKLPARYGNGFDLIVAFDLFEHLEIPDLVATLETLRGLMRPNARIVARFPNGQSPFGRFHQYGDVTHKSVLSIPIMDQLAQKVGLRIERATNSFPGRSGGRLKRAGQALRDGLRALLLGALALLFATGTRNLDANVTVILRASEPTPPS